MFSGQFYETWVSVRERNTKLLLETVTYIATTETVTLNYNRNSHVHNALQKHNATCIITVETPTCIISVKIVYPHIHCRNVHLHKCHRNF